GVASQPAGPHGRVRRDVDYGSASRSFFHCRYRASRSHEHAVDVDLHDAAPVLRGHLDDAATAADADIVVEAIEPAELVDGGIDHCSGLALLGDVGNKGGGGSALVRNHC